MRKILTEKLWSYIVENNPELVFRLQENYSVMKYLEQQVSQVLPLAESMQRAQKPQYLMIEQCMETLTAELRPSRFQYLKAILDEEFEYQYDRLQESGLMTCELINMMEACKPIFERAAFSEDNEHDPQIRYQVMGAISEYLDTLNFSIV